MLPLRPQKTETMLNLILFGPPGSGKGTQASKLVDKYGLIHISTGDLFRYEMKNDTPLGVKAKEYMAKGELVPDEVTIGMLKNRVGQEGAPKGFIFDGFPRTIPQAEALDAYLSELNTSITGLIALEVDDQEIIDRILLRGKTSGRPDDNDAQIIRNRIDVYREETAPVYDYYGKSNRSHLVSGIGTIEQILDRLCNAVDALDAD